ncbi:hypothetical protein BgiBS90_035667 [Biomphalaria glabrata]|nr:hypothetical protein BgiBS90_035667 [Biomphalaria glabrata]
MKRTIWLLWIVTSAVGLTCRNKNIFSKLFLDKAVEPIGCNETSMWTFPSWSKLACALSCLATNSCAVFSYSRETSTCSICQGDVIQNLTFTSGKVFSWPYKYYKTKLESANVPDGVNIGTLVHLFGYFYGDVATSGFVRLNPFYSSPRFPLCLHLNNSHIVVHSTQSRMRYIQLSPDALEVNSTHTVDILVADNGYQVFLDESFIAFEPHVFPYNISKNIQVGGSIEIYELIV